MKSDRGYTLIELVMTLALLIVGVPPLINLGSNCLRNMHHGTYATTATYLCQERLERILADNASDSLGFAYITSGHYGSEASITGFPGYTRSTSIATDSTYNGTTFRNVSVTTQAPDATSITLSTWVLDQ